VLPVLLLTKVAQSAESLDPDFFNDASAVLPVLLLTKFAARARRRMVGAQLTWKLPHRIFIGIALAGETLALLGAAVKEARPWSIWLIALSLAAAGGFVGYELWHGEPDGT
jgi:hypothetical protein